MKQTIEEELKDLEQEVEDAREVATQDEEAFKIAAQHMENSKLHLVEQISRLQDFKLEHNIQ